jgi:dTDP-4-dehydrorhamnose reductase
MRTLILGASGLIGGNLHQLLLEKSDWPVVGTHFSYQAKDTLFFNTLDLRDPNNLDVPSFKPEVVVHCGALTHVDYCEENPEESYTKTVQSTRNALKLAESYNSDFIYISTDYVFDGKAGPYTENEAINPVSVYGRHKLEAERAVLNSGVNFLICRVTNVYGKEERGKNFIARLIESARSGEKMEFTFPIDQFATPINAMDVARALVQLMTDGKRGIYHLASTDFLNRYQLAMRVLKHFPNHKITINPILTSEMNQAAERPLNGGLISAKFLSEYPTFEYTNVDDYLNQPKHTD